MRSLFLSNVCLLLCTATVRHFNEISPQEQTLIRNKRDNEYSDVFHTGDEDKSCVVNGIIYNIAELSKCNEVYGALKIAPFTKTVEIKDAKISYVQGCVEIVNTDLRDINFLKTLEQIDCHEPTGNKIMGNKFLCMSKGEQTAIQKVIPMMDIMYDECPLCTPEDFEHLGEHKHCITFIGEYEANRYSVSTLEGADLIVGHLIIENGVNSDLKRKKKLRIRCDSCNGDPAVVIRNTTMPHRDFFYNLEIDPKRSPVALAMQLNGFRFLRDIHAMLQHNVKDFELKVEPQEDEDCWLPDNDYENPFDYQDLIFCGRIMGKLVFDSTGIEDLRSSWKEIITTHDKIRITGGSELFKVFAPNVNVKYSHPDFQIEISFRPPLCLDVNVMRLARKWMTEGKSDNSDQIKVVYKNQHECTEYVGQLTDYDLRQDDGTKMKHLEGTIYLEALKIEKIFKQLLKNEKMEGMVSNTAKPPPDVFNIDITRFKKLLTINKPHDVEKNVPVVRIDMCLFMIDVPEWVFNVNISSPRGDDIYFRIRGPGYKLKKEDYFRLAEKHGRHRLDIDPLQDGECVIDQPVEDLKKLDRCDTIIGDLELNQDTYGETTTVIKHITGCVKIVQTSLEHLNFIKLEVPYSPEACFKCKGKTAFEISNNPSLCFDKFNFAKNIHDRIFKNKENCTSEPIEKNFLIYGVNDSSSLDNWDSVEEIRGRIIVSGNTADRLDVFPNLTKITYLGPGPAILIENNPNLVSFKLPKLKSIVVADKDKPAMVIRSNPKLKIEDKVKSELKSATANGTVLEENEEAEVEEKRIKREEAERIEREKMSLGMAMGIGFAATLGIIVVGVAIVVIVLMMKKKKISVRPKKSKAKKEKKKETTKTATKDKTTGSSKDQE